MSKLARQISLLCSTCGRDKFEMQDDNYTDFFEASDDVKVKCIYCNRVFTKKELLEDNQEMINANIEDVKNEIMKDIEKDFKKLFRRM